MDVFDCVDNAAGVVSIIWKHQLRRDGASEAGKCRWTQAMAEASDQHVPGRQDDGPGEYLLDHQGD